MTKKQAEIKLSEVVAESWNRVRSSSELESFIARRELALQTVEVAE